MNEIVEGILRKTALFASLTDKEMEALTGRARNLRFERGALLFSEGDSCTGLFLVASGKIRIFKLSAAGREQVLAVEGPGSSFAELPVFDGGNYPASASALEDAEVLFISRKDFQNFCREHPDVALKVIAVVGSRLRRLVGIIEELSFTTVDCTHPAASAGERNSFERRCSSGANEDPSRLSGRTRHRARTCFAESRPAAGRRVSGCRGPQDRSERP